MNKLILGTVQFGLNYGIANQTGKVSESDSKNMLQICRTNNIRMLDTAINYGDSEKCLGALSSNQPTFTCTSLGIVAVLPITEKELLPRSVSA